MLDEPTNHLDLDALEWLEEHLRRRHGVAARGVARPGVPRRDRRPGLGAARPEPDRVFRGDYSAYHRQREERDARAVKDADTQAEPDRAREGARPALPSPPQVQQDARARGPARATPGRAARGAEGPATKLAIPTAALAGGGPSRSGEIVVRVEGLVGRLPARVAARRPPTAARPRRPSVVATRPVPGRPARRPDRDRRAERRGQDDAAAHDRRRPAAARRVGHVRQRGPARLPRPAARARRSRARRCSMRCSRRSRSRPARRAAYLARFLFRGDDAFKEVRLLSGGERSRLELALLGIQPSNLLLLDEPTNHLDIPAREAIEAFMRDSPATLARRVARSAPARDRVRPAVGRRIDGAARAVRRWLPGVAGRRGRRLDGASGRSRQEAAARGAGDRPARVAATAAAAAPASDRVAAPSGRPERPRPRRQRQPRPRRRSCRRTPTGARRPPLEAELTRLGLRKNHLELAMADPNVQRNFVELRRVTSELADVDSRPGRRRGRLARLEERAP